MHIIHIHIDQCIKIHSNIATKDPGQKPLHFDVGFGSVIKGWEDSVIDVSVRERSRINCSSDFPSMSVRGVSSKDGTNRSFTWVSVKWVAFIVRPTTILGVSSRAGTNRSITWVSVKSVTSIVRPTGTCLNYAWITLGTCHNYALSFSWDFPQLCLGSCISTCDPLKKTRIDICLF